MKYTLPNGKNINIPDSEIKSHMANLQLTEEEAIQLYLEDEGYLDNEELEELDFCEWWEMLDDIERGEYNRCMKELEESEI